MSRINVVSNESASAEQRALLDAVHSQLGVVPNFLRVFANSPAALQGFLGLYNGANSGLLDAQTMDASASNPGIVNKPKAAGWLSRIRRLPRSIQIGGGILIVYLFVALTGDLWAPYDYNQIATGKPFEKPSLEHYFGTDQLGRDVFSRVVEGTDIVLFLALTSTLLATIIGGVLGLVSGFVGGWFDQGAMRVVDIIISIPFLVLGLLLISVAGPELSGSYQLLIFVIAFVYAPK